MRLDAWTPRPRPGLRALAGTRVRLEPLDWATHGDGLFAALGGQANADLWRYMPIGPFSNLKELKQRIDQSRTEQAWETLVIRDVATNAVLGMASYMRIREAHGSAEIGCVAFGHQMQRTTAATEALMLMASHVFDDLGYRRYEWKCYNINLASKRCAERFGFQFEGVFRNDLVSKGENRDTAWFSIIDSEWPTLRSALVAWLTPDNFDASGRQIQRLEALR